jgi:hypothetical protein
MEAHRIPAFTTAGQDDLKKREIPPGKSLESRGRVAVAVEDTNIT